MKTTWSSISLYTCFISLGLIFCLATHSHHIIVLLLLYSGTIIWCICAIRLKINSVEIKERVFSSEGSFNIRQRTRSNWLQKEWLMNSAEVQLKVSTYRCGMQKVLLWHWNYYSVLGHFLTLLPSRSVHAPFFSIRMYRSYIEMFAHQDAHTYLRTSLSIHVRIWERQQMWTCKRKAIFS